MTYHEISRTVVVLRWLIYGFSENKLPQNQIYNHVSFQKDYFGVITVGQNYRKNLTINNHGINPIGIELGNTWDQVGRYNKYAVSRDLST